MKNNLPNFVQNFSAYMWVKTVLKSSKNFVQIQANHRIQIVLRKLHKNKGFATFIHCQSKKCVNNNPNFCFKSTESIVNWIHLRATMHMWLLLTSGRWLVVVVDMWLLFWSGRYHKFDCLPKLFWKSSKEISFRYDRSFSFCTIWLCVYFTDLWQTFLLLFLQSFLFLISFAFCPKKFFCAKFLSYIQFFCISIMFNLFFWQT